VAEYVIIIKPNITNNNIRGNNTKNQDISLYPALHNEFNMKVQNNIYIALNTNTINVFGNSHSKYPKQYFVVFPKF
jgi:hypothetical protein